MITTHATKVVHGPVHIRHLLHLLLIWLELLLVGIVSMVVGRCLKLGLDQFLLLYYLLLALGDPVRI